MSKTLPKCLTENEKSAEVMKPGKEKEVLIDLMQEMKAYWNDAADDLVQPRPEAVAQLLKKVLH